MILGRHSSSARRKARLQECSDLEHRCSCWLYENKPCVLGFSSSRPKVRVPLWVTEERCPSCEVQKRFEQDMFEADMEMDENILREMRES
jgi:hypothetical protein